ncbi:MAG: hypothetical protein IJ165_11370 [Proteobacteria bacterium]|nr:hypothetical protein [Pseudomonadota bacterium]
MRSRILIGVFLAMLPAGALAQGTGEETAGIPEPAAEGVVDVQISQPLVTKKFGEITLPFSWTVEETEDRVTAVEKLSDQPAVFALDLVKYPQMMPERKVVDEIANVLAKALGTQGKVEKRKQKLDCGKKTCPEIVYYTVELEGTEDGVMRKCALEMIPSKGQVVTLSICAEAAVKYSMPLPDILHQIFLHMK